MKHLLLFLQCFFLLPLVSLSQIADGTSHEDKSAKSALGYSTILKFAPLSLMDIYSSIQFAVEQKVGPKSALQLEAGYIFPLSVNEGDQNENYENMSGLRIRSEYRYYLIVSKEKKGGLYLAPELLFIDLNYDMEEIDRVYFFQGDGSYYYKKYEYDIDKKIFGLHAKIGYQVISGRFVMDFYGGLGGRNVSVKSGKPGEEGLEFDEDRNEWDFFPSDKESGKFPRFSASLGFKVGIRLK